MPVLDAVHTFAGIANENEFYSHHYLAEVFKGDIKSRLDAWDAAEAEHPAQPRKRHRAPAQAPAGLGAEVVCLRGQVQRARDDRAWQIFTQLQAGLAAGPGLRARQTTHPHELVPGQPMPLWQVPGAKLPRLIPRLPARRRRRRPARPPAAGPALRRRARSQRAARRTWADLLSDAVFGADQPPRYVILVGLDEWLLLDRYKWPNNRAALRLGRHPRPQGRRHPARPAPRCCTTTAWPPARATACSRPGRKRPQARLRRQRRPQVRAARSHRAAGQRSRPPTATKRPAPARRRLHRQGQARPGDLSLECLRMVYRLLFMFYIEARPELGYVPIAKSEVYLKGYSLESLRDLEMQPLTRRMRATASTSTPRCAACSSWWPGLRLQPAAERGWRRWQAPRTPSPWRRWTAACSTTAPCRCWQGAFPQPCVATHHPLMSLTRGKGKGQASGPGQLPAAVHQPAGRRVRGAAQLPRLLCRRRPLRGAARAQEGRSAAAPATMTTMGDGEHDADDSRAVAAAGTSRPAGQTPGSSPPAASTTTKTDERVYDINEPATSKLRKHPKGSFIYRLAGRDRQKSASYYTPQVLTRAWSSTRSRNCWQNDRVQEGRRHPHPHRLRAGHGQRRVLERSRQPAGRGLPGAQAEELGKRIPHDQYPQELQKVRMYWPTATCSAWT
jgi:hypothetical protein